MHGKARVSKLASIQKRDFKMKSDVSATVHDMISKVREGAASAAFTISLKVHSNTTRRSSGSTMEAW